MAEPGPALASATVAVLYGGTSPERDVSLATGREIVTALAPGPLGPARLIPVEIEASGAWRVDGESLSPSAALERLADVDLFYLGLHGGEGENGTLQGLLRAQGFRHTGADVAGSAVCMDKLLTRNVAVDAGLRVARGGWTDRKSWAEAREHVVAYFRDFDARGLVVKPRRGGSSVLTAVVDDAAGIAEPVEAILESGDDALIEERIHGIETTVPVLGNRAEELRALPLVEIRPHDGRFFDYEEKYSESGAVELCPPESIPAEACELLSRWARRLHHHLGLEGYSRTDFLVPVGTDEPPVFLEVNTLPGFTARSLFPKAARAAGIEFDALCREIAALGLRA